jgi:hypothetical protein
LARCTILDSQPELADETGQIHRLVAGVNGEDRAWQIQRGPTFVQQARQDLVERARPGMARPKYAPA